MRGIDIDTKDVTVDKDGTAWVYDPTRDEFRYLTEDGLSYDSYDYPLDSGEPYVKLDGPAASLIRASARKLFG